MAAASGSTAAARAPLAVTGKSTLVTEYHRKLKGYSWWKQIILDLTREWLIFCDTKLELPTIIHHDKKGYFTIDYAGVFNERELAMGAIEARRAREPDPDIQYNWAQVDRNGMAPSKSGRYDDRGFVGPPVMAQERANVTVVCPFNHSRCNPNDTISRQTINKVATTSRQNLLEAQQLNETQRQ